MLERIRDAAGQVLDADAYLADFWPYFRQISDVLWKLERIQDFREPDEPSWVAMSEGDWDRSLRLVEEMRASAAREFRDGPGFEMRRLRVAEHPVTAYLQWEMQVLRVRAEAGEQIRVIPAGAVSHLEVSGPLPELVVLGTQVLYEVLYDTTGTLSGARRITAPEVIGACRDELGELYAKGEDVLAYFEREIAPLPPPG
jgi:hypothetical protein